MSMAIIGAVVAVGTAVYGIAEGSNQKRRGRHAKESADRAAAMNKEKVPTELLQNQQLAAIRANTGLPSEQYALSQKNIQREQMRTLKGAQDRKLAGQLLPALNDNATQQQGRLDAQNADARLRNERVLMDVNSQVAGVKRSIFQKDVRDINNRDFDYAMGLIGSGNQNMANGISSIGNLAGSAMMSRGVGSIGSNSSWTSGLFAGRGSRISGTNVPKKYGTESYYQTNQNSGSGSYT